MIKTSKERIDECINIRTQLCNLGLMVDETLNAAVITEFNDFIRNAKNICIKHKISPTSEIEIHLYSNANKKSGLKILH